MKSIFRQMSILIAIILCITSTAVLGFNIISTTAPNGYSLNINYESIAYDDNILEATSTYQGSLKQYTTPVICDIDRDGVGEIMTYSGNTINIVHRDATGFYLEKSISISPFYNTTNTQINWLACMTDESGFYVPDNSYVLAVHQGTTNGQSEVSYIGYNVDVGTSDLTGTTDFGDGFMKFGGLLNMPMTIGGVSCDSQKYIQGGSGIERNRVSCAYAHSGVAELVFFTLFAQSDGAGGYYLFWNQTSVGPLTGLTNQAYIPVDVDPTGIYAVTSVNGGRNDVQPGPPIAFMYGPSLQPNFYYTFFANSGFRMGHAYLTGISVTTTAMPINVPTNSPGNFITTDINGDGYKDACFTGYHALIGQDIRPFLWCGSTTGTELLDVYPLTGNNAIFSAITAFDITNNGDKEIFAYMYSNNDNADNDVYIYLGNDNGYTHPLSVRAENVNLGRFYSMPIVPISPNEFVIIAGGNTFRINNAVPATTTISEDVALTGLVVYDTAIQTDVDYDYSPESMFIDSATGTFRLYYHDDLPLLPTISLVNNTRYGGGYFGWDPLSCLDSPVTIKATECTDGQAVCTYENTIEFERERICTTCAGTQALTCGNWSYASPEIQCSFISSGDKTIQVYLETESKIGLAQGLVSFNVQMTGTDLSCNTNILTSPATFEDPDAPPVDPEEPTEPPSPVEEAYDNFIDSYVDNIPGAFKFIISVVIMLGFALAMNRETNGNQTMTFLGILMGAGVAVVLQLLAIEIVIIVGVLFIVGAIVLHKFEGTKI